MVWETLRAIGRRHEALKKKIHNTRIPLGPRGRAMMSLVYLTSPVIFGYYLMQYTNQYAENHSRKRIEAIRDESIQRQGRILNSIEEKRK
mmetsp:Transcript_18912/g.46440  ORF Transcript_18912/g.46440 Transcript_18912/m.46440 type:complete len:90 (+) Transcript_18912:303-572(+)